MSPTQDEEIERILNRIKLVPHYKGAHTSKIIGKQEAKAALHRLILRARRDEAGQNWLVLYEECEMCMSNMGVRNNRIAQLDSEIEGEK